MLLILHDQKTGSANTHFNYFSLKLWRQVDYLRMVITDGNQGSFTHLLGSEP